jgi:hypothetical protein
MFTTIGKGIVWKAFEDCITAEMNKAREKSSVSALIQFYEGSRNSSVGFDKQSVQKFMRSRGITLKSVAAELEPWFRTDVMQLILKKGTKNIDALMKFLIANIDDLKIFLQNKKT